MKHTKKYIQNFSQKIWRRDHLEDLGIDGKIILKQVLTQLLQYSTKAEQSSTTL
jgi:hypothetical protein